MVQMDADVKICTESELHFLWQHALHCHRRGMHLQNGLVTQIFTFHQSDYFLRLIYNFLNSVGACGKGPSGRYFYLFEIVFDLRTITVRTVMLF